MYAIIETGGKQYRVSPGSTVKIEKITGDRGNKVVLDKVLAVSDGESLTVGTPYVEGAVVTGTIMRQGKGKRIKGFKYKAKTNYRKRYGHRQLFTEVRIDSIETDVESTVSA